MSLETVPTSDLRREAKEAKRDHDRRAKWAYGVRERGPRGHEMKLRPDKAWSQLPWRPSSEHHMNQISRSAERIAFRYDVKEFFENRESDSSAIQDTSQLKALDWEISAPDDMHPFDALSGNTALFAAVMVAEEKFETREIEKLVKEYEFVTEETHERGYLSSDDEFQLVEYSEP